MSIVILDSSANGPESYAHALTALLGTDSTFSGGEVTVLACQCTPLVGRRFPCWPAFTHSSEQDTGWQAEPEYMGLVSAFAHDLKANLPALRGKALVAHSATAAVLQGLSDTLAQSRELPDSLFVLLRFGPGEFLSSQAERRPARKRYERALLGLRRIARKEGIALLLSAVSKPLSDEFGALIGETVPVLSAPSDFPVPSPEARALFPSALYALLTRAAVGVGCESRQRFIQHPAEWQHAKDAICQALAVEPAVEGNCPLLLYSPHATLNSYQDLLHMQDRSVGIETRPIALVDPLSPVLLSALQHEPMFFHQHWLKDIYWDSASVAEGELRIDRHLGTLRAMKEFGVRVIWTLHNLAEHDASELQSTLGARARSGMARLADHILCHTRGAINALEEATGESMAPRAKVLPHPLYDDLLEHTTSAPPPELRKDIPSRIWLLTGLLRPYKGTQELLRVWQRILNSATDCPVHLVIAGHIQDPPVHPLIAAVKGHAGGRLTVIPRRLDDSELAALLQHSELVVAPYRRVLTSGTYYLATTFSKPVLAPAKGMFPEVVEHGQSGWLYDGSEAALEQSLRALLKEPPETFRQVGEEARRRNEDATASAVSRRFFEWLLSLQN